MIRIKAFSEAFRAVDEGGVILEETAHIRGWKTDTLFDLQCFFSLKTNKPNQPSIKTKIFIFFFALGGGAYGRARGHGCQV